MDIHGNNPDADIFGNPSSTIWGSETNANGWGDPPFDVFGNATPESLDVGVDLYDTIADALGGLFGG